MYNGLAAGGWSFRCSLAGDRASTCPSPPGAAAHSRTACIASRRQLAADAPLSLFLSCAAVASAVPLVRRAVQYRGGQMAPPAAHPANAPHCTPCTPRSDAD